MRRFASVLLLAAVMMTVGCKDDKPEKPAPPEPVEVTGVEVSPATLSLEIGDEHTLTVEITPEDADIVTVEWESSDDDVATVSNRGEVRAVGAGVAVITVTTVQGGFEEECTVTVASPLESVFVVDGGTYVGMEIPEPTAQQGEHIVDVDVESSVVSVSSSVELQKFYVGIDGQDGYYEFEVDAVATRAEFSYSFTLELGDLDEGFTILISGLTAGGNVLPIYSHSVTADGEDGDPDPVLYSITATAGDGGRVTISSESAQERETITVTAVPNDGYEFAGWSVSEGVVLSSSTALETSFTMLAHDVEIRAEFAREEAPTYNVTFTSVTGLTFKAVPARAEEGQTVTVTATPATGYTFDGWSVVSGGVTLGDDSEATTTFTMSANNVVLTATAAELGHIVSIWWEKIAEGEYLGGEIVSIDGDTDDPRIVKFETEPTGTVVAATGVKMGETVAINALTFASGYVFEKWRMINSIGEIMDLPGDSFEMPDADVVLTPFFEYEPVLYSVNVNYVEGQSGYWGTVSVAGTGYEEEGTTVEIKAVPAEGYEFVKWIVKSGNVTLGSATAATTTFVMPAGDVSIEGEFRQKTYTVSVVWTAEGEGYLGAEVASIEGNASDPRIVKFETEPTGTVVAATGVKMGETVAINALTFASGYVFIEWTTETSGTISFSNSTAETDFQMPAANVVLTPVFAPN